MTTMLSLYNFSMFIHLFIYLLYYSCDVETTLLLLVSSLEQQRASRDDALSAERRGAGYGRAGASTWLPEGGYFSTQLNPALLS